MYAPLVEGIGWDVVSVILPYIKQKQTRVDAVRILDIVTTKGNAKEVFLKCIEGLKTIAWEPSVLNDEEEINTVETIIEKRNGTTPTEEDPLDTIAQTSEIFRATIKGLIGLNNAKKFSVQKNPNRTTGSILDDLCCRALNKYNKFTAGAGRTRAC